jgi:signal transduction histidine kinase/CheY-like chemotaxis protein
MITSILTVEIRCEHDIVLARQRARQIAELLHFDRQDQVRIATAVSELARNVFQYASTGKVEFQLYADGEHLLQVKVTDRGPGIADLKSILEGAYVSQTGMGLGLMGVRRLMDKFEIESPGRRGTTVLIGKRLPPVSASVRDIAVISEQLIRQTAQSPFEEIQRQNQELLAALDELEKRQNELTQVNRELEETNRGVVALYAELDEKAESVRRASEVKSRFLSNITHELRTPLNSITSLTRILLSRADGDLTSEQDRQVNYIRRAAENLTELVNDLLDLAKVDSGKVTIRPAPLEIKDLFAALRGMLRPLTATNPTVSLVFEEPDDLPALFTDESKLSQILRNFISNALKYTEQGEIRIKAVCEPSERVTLSVADTGIGIAPENHSVIFEEFVQVEGPHQKKVKGTGLGLPLSKKLAELLGGHVQLASQLGQGSTFSVTLPRVFEPRDVLPRETAREATLKPRDERRRPPVLVVDDDPEARFALRQMLAPLGFQCIEAEGGAEGVQRARQFLPAAILLDLAMPDVDGFAVLDRLAADERTRCIPIVIHTSRNLTETERSLVENKSVAILRKTQTDAKLKDALRAAGLAPVEGEKYADHTAP